MRPTISLSAALLVASLVTAGCSTQKSAQRVLPRDPLSDRATFVERRANELVRRGVPNDQAVQAASGEWFNRTLAADTRADDARRVAQNQLVRDLEKMTRAPGAR